MGGVGMKRKKGNTMKKRILIIEDNAAKFFSLKQMIGSLLRVPVKEAAVSNAEEIFVKTVTFKPETIIFAYEGSALELFKDLKAKGVNCRNTEIGMIKAEDLTEYSIQSLKLCFEKMEEKSPKKLFRNAKAA